MPRNDLFSLLGNQKALARVVRTAAQVVDHVVQAPTSPSAGSTGSSSSLEGLVDNVVEPAISIAFLPSSPTPSVTSVRRAQPEQQSSANDEKSIPLHERPILDQREIFHKLHATIEDGVDKLNVKEKEFMVVINHEHETPNTIVTMVFEPSDDHSRGTLFYIPGTASKASASQISRAICKRLSSMFQCHVVAIFHRLSPENHYPVPYNDVERVVNAIIDGRVTGEHPMFNLDSIVLSGYSSGALLAVQYAMKNKDRLNRLLLISPVLDLSGEKVKRVKTDKSLCDEEFFTTFVSTFLYSETANQYAKAWEASPIYANGKQLEVFPPTDIFVGKNDYFLNDSEVFVPKLKEAGVLAKLHDVPGHNHALPWKSLECISKSGLCDNFFGSLSHEAKAGGISEDVSSVVKGVTAERNKRRESEGKADALPAADVSAQSAAVSEPPALS